MGICLYPAVAFKTLSLFTTPSLFLARPAVCRILVPSGPGLNPCTLQWKGGVLTTGGLGKSPHPLSWPLTTQVPGIYWRGGGVRTSSTVLLGLAVFLSLFSPSTLAVLYYFFFDLFCSLCPILLSLLPIFFLHLLYLFPPLLSLLPSVFLSFLISPPPSLSSFSLPVCCFSSVVSPLSEVCFPFVCAC